jgi:hypothetical protein
VPSIVDVTFGPLSDGQKPECLFCGEPATQEAVLEPSRIRCCDAVPCKARAIEFALVPFAKIKHKEAGHDA